MYQLTIKVQSQFNKRVRLDDEQAQQMQNIHNEIITVNLCGFGFIFKNMAIYHQVMGMAIAMVDFYTYRFIHLHQNRAITSFVCDRNRK